MSENIHNPATGERTFTQEQVNAIVSERLSKEKQKGESALAEREKQFAEREQQLANREALIDLKDQLKEKGLPSELLPVLNVQDREALQTALDALDNYIARKIEARNPRQVQELKLPEIKEHEPGISEIRKAMGLR